MFDICVIQVYMWMFVRYLGEWAGTGKLWEECRDCLDYRWVVGEVGRHA